MPNTDLIIIRLLPNPPTDAVTFGRYLANLTIDAYDQNLIDVSKAPTGYQELLLGSIDAADGIITYPEEGIWNDIMLPLDPKKLQNSIVQHVVVLEPFVGAPLLGTLKAVATVVMTVKIKFPDPTNTTHLEYPGPNGYDIRLDIKRNGIPLESPEIEWNAKTYSVPELSPWPVDYMGIVANGDPLLPGFPVMSQPSLYALIPDAPTPLPPGTASILLSKDGTPPNFDNLKSTIDTVLGVYNLAAGTKLANLTTPLTEQQCSEISHEIAYNRAWFPLPPPLPKYPPPVGNPNGIEDLYTAPNKDNDQTRSQFEGNLTAYHAKLDAIAMKLSKYIFAAAAAIDAERKSATSTMAQMTFPLDPTITKTKAVTAEVSIILTSWDDSVEAPNTTTITPDFIVPAAYFYALGFQLPTNMSRDRYKATINVSNDYLVKTIQWAVDNGVLNPSEPTVTQTINFSINTAQAIRRLAALIPNVIPSSQPMIYVQNATSITTGWRDNLSTDSAFWTPAEFSSPEYLKLLIEVVAGGDTALAAAIAQAPLVGPAPLKKLQFANQLPLVTTMAWATFFTTGNPAPALPNYTAPGKTDYRIKAFVRKLNQIFSVGWEAPAHEPAGPGAVPMLDINLGQDMLATFLQANPTFLSNPWSDTPATSDIDLWTQEALKNLWTLVQITKFTAATPPQTALTPALRMSYMEALYSRGLVSADKIAVLSTAQFILAISGTVIELKDAGTIYEIALTLHNNISTTGSEPAFGFQPANPGDLVNCIPPANLCPLGHVEYLHEMLEVQSNDVTILKVVSARRGNIGELHTTMSNLGTNVPEIDLVIESLESLGSGINPGANMTIPVVGAVYDTSLDLRKTYGVSDDSFLTNDAILAVVPENSSPAVKIKSPAVYGHLKSCLTSPSLPFSRPLEISRSYLCSIGTDMFETMHRFRRNITEFAIDPTTDPTDFQKQVSRLPVRLEIGLEYLCISQDEYKLLYSTDVPSSTVINLYGFDVSTETWSSNVRILETFLSATGLSYCELVCLQESRWVNFKIIPTVGDNTDNPDHIIEQSLFDSGASLPKCPPCCLSKWQIDFGEIENIKHVLKALILFIRLWRTLNSGCRGKISFNRLADICVVLKLFDSNGKINPGFIQQLPSLIMLHDFFGLSWTDNSSHDNIVSNDNTKLIPGVFRTKILALWDKKHSTAQDWNWAIQALLNAVQRCAENRYGCSRRETEYLKVIADNLDPLSKLAGFSIMNTWYQSPTCTIRFAEVLTKIYASRFTVGEILFLFTAQDHLDGDDPFPISSTLETIDRPLELPDDTLFDSLDALRRKLLCVEVSNEECEKFGWNQIESIIRDAGYSSTSKDDQLLNLAKHFFPETLEKSGQRVSIEERRYSVPLSRKQTSPKIWSAEPCFPFHFTDRESTGTDDRDLDQAAELWTIIPLRDEEVFRKLQTVRQLRSAEIVAVKDLYYMPRAALAPFALLFDNFGHSVERLVQEPNEHERFTYFKRAVLLFHRRCEIVSSHLAAHVKAAVCRDNECGCREPGIYQQHEKRCSEEETHLAWTVLRTLIADENTASRSPATGDPWEDDGGSPPPTFTWNSNFSGSAIAAILGLIGTGLKENIETKSGVQWTDMRGGLECFGQVRNAWNVPVPTIIPKLSLLPNPTQDDIVSFKNGFAFRDKDEAILHGAEPFILEWRGTLIVDCAGCYVFSAGKPHSDEGRPQYEDCDDVMWLVSLQRGQQMFTLLSYGHETFAGRAFKSREVRLEKGIYAITVEFNQKKPKYEHALDVERMTTGFQIKWESPDSNNRCLVVPFSNLITNAKDAPLAISVEGGGGSSVQFRRLQYSSSLRDIRRTYQRAFKALLFAQKFYLDAKERHCDDISEIQYLLKNAQQFHGTSFYQVARDASPNTWVPHHVWLDFNFLPVGDPYLTPDATVDSRADPSQKRQAAMFDWWERMFDYTSLRDQMKKCSKRPLWLLFHEANLDQSFSDLANLVRYLKVNPALLETLLSYSLPNNTIYTMASADLSDERGVTRVWLAKQYVRHIVNVFHTEILEDIRPALWAADDLEIDITIGQRDPESGLKNLVGFIQTSILRSDECASRLSALLDLNNGLRKRCRNALVTYLTQLNRVQLQDGTAITTSRQLSDSLLQDVRIDVGKSTTRVLDAISAVQKFAQRARIGLEPQFTIAPDFSHDWECKFVSFEVWVAQARRKIYGENWVQWEELKTLEKGSEAGSLLVAELTASVENIAEPARPLATSSGSLLPNKDGLEPVQNEENVILDQHMASTIEGLTLLGTPDHSARPTLLLALSSARGSADNPTTMATTNGETSGEHLRSIARRSIGSIPMWIESAIRLGTRFVRVAASARPPAFPYELAQEKACCDYCDKMHVPSIDEYYFWLKNVDSYDDKDAPQNADINTSSDDDPTAPAWSAPDQVPDIFEWPKEPSAVLFWTRLHGGQLLPPRRSAEGVRLDLLTQGSSTALKLELEGRDFDSLFLTIAGRNLDPTKPSGTNHGFRYDITTDAAVVTPQIKPDTFPDSVGDGFGDFAGFPWFAYFQPGKPLTPPTPFGVSLALGTKLKDNCQYEAALNWFRTAFDPLTRDNTWATCKRPRELATINGVATNAEAPRTTVVIARERGFRDSPCCPAVTTQSSSLRSRAVFLEYLDTLLLWSDQLAEVESPERAQQALVLLETMEYLLGKTPEGVNAHPSAIFDTMTVESFVPSAPPLNPRLLKLYDEVESRKSMMRHKFKGSGTGGCSSCNSGNLLGSQSSGLTAIGQESRCGSLCPAASCQPYRFNSIFPKATELAAIVKGLASTLVSAYERGDGDYLAALRQAHERTVLDLGIDTAKNQWRAADWEVQTLGENMQSALTRLRYSRFLLSRNNITGEEAYQTGTQTAMNSNSGANINQGMATTFNMIPDFAFGVAGMGPYQSTQIPIGQKMAGMASGQAQILNTVAAISSTQASLSLTQAGWQRRNEDWQHQIDLSLIEIAQIKRQTLASQRRRDVALRELNNHQRQLEHSEEVLDFMRDKFSRHSMYLFLQRETGMVLRGIFDLALRTAHEAHQAFLFERAPITPGSVRPFPTAAELWSGPFQGVNAGDRLDLALRRLEREYMNNNCRELELNKRISLRESFPKEFIELRLWGKCEVDIREWRFDQDHPGLWMRRLKSVALSVPCVAGAYTGVHARLKLLGSKIRTEPLVRRASGKCCKPKQKIKQSCCCAGNGKCEDGSDDPYLVRRFVSERSSAALTATSHGQDDSGLFETNLRDERYLPFEYEGAISKWTVEMPEFNNLFDFQSLADVVINLNYTARDGGDEMRRKSMRNLGFGGPEEGWWRAFEIRREFPDSWPNFEGNGMGFNGGRGCNECVQNRHHDHHHHHHDFHSSVSTSSQLTPPRTPSPHHRHGGHFDFPLRLSRGMFPFLAPGAPPVRVTTLCIYLVLAQRNEHNHQHNHDHLGKENDGNDTCQCGDEANEKKCCCPSMARHFPLQFIPPGQMECREKWRVVELVPEFAPLGVLVADKDGFSTLEHEREIYHCEIGNLDLPSIGHDERNKPMRGVSGGGEIYGHLRFPRSMGKVKEAWVLCGFELLLPGQARSGGCHDDSQRDGRGKRDEMEGRDGKQRGKYFLDTSDD